MASVAQDNSAGFRDRGAETRDPHREGLGHAFRYLLGTARRNLWIILALVAFALAAAIVVTMLQTPRYTAAATVQINDQADQVLDSEMESQSAANSSWDIERFLNTQLEILRSRGLAERVADRLELYDDPAFFTGMGLEPPAAGVSEKMRRNLVVSLVRGNMAVDLPRDTRIAAITFTSNEPVLSARLANAYAAEFIQANLQRRFDSSSYARTFIGEQLEEARARLESSERDLNAYAREAGLLRVRGAGSEEGGGNTSVTLNSLSQLNQAANEAQARRVAAESRWQAEQAAPLLFSATVLANPTVQTLMTRRSQLDADLQAQRSRYLDDHPAVTELRTQLRATETELQQVGRAVRDSVRADYVAARQAEQQLDNRVSSLRGATLAEQDRAVRYNTLAREADTNRSLYDGLLQRYRELNAAAGIATSNVSIIDLATPPGAPSSPSLVKNLLLALALGLILAAAFVFLREQLDDAIRVPEDVEEKLDMPLLGIIPEAENDDPATELEDPKSSLSEAYNSLRTSLLYATREGLPQVLLITSAQPSEGKTTSSFAIARGLAKLGRKIALIDGDLRLPAAHRRLGFDNSYGLSSLLTSDDPVSRAALPTDEPNLSVIPSGPIPPSPTELLSSPRFAAILQELAATHDCVIIDSPPVLGLADAPVMAPLADGVIVMVEANRSRRGMLRSALRRMRATDSHILGIVLSKFDPTKSANRYSEYYGYEYYRYAPAEGEAA